MQAEAELLQQDPSDVSHAEVKPDTVLFHQAPARSLTHFTVLSMYQKQQRAFSVGHVALPGVLHALASVVIEQEQVERVK